jgi:hypothetical protein
LVSLQPSIVVRQDDVYGPDCTITLTVGGSISKIEVQQDYCFFEAGNVTATVLSGYAQISKEAAGSYSQSLPGQIWLTVFED